MLGHTLFPRISRRTPLSQGPDCTPTGSDPPASRGRKTQTPGGLPRASADRSEPATPSRHQAGRPPAGVGRTHMLQHKYHRHAMADDRAGVGRRPHDRCPGRTALALSRRSAETGDGRKTQSPQAPTRGDHGISDVGPTSFEASSSRITALAYSGAVSVSAHRRRSCRRGQSAAAGSFAAPRRGRPIAEEGGSL